MKTTPLLRDISVMSVILRLSAGLKTSTDKQKGRYRFDTALSIERNFLIDVLETSCISICLFFVRLF